MAWSLIFWEQDRKVIQIYFDEKGWQARGLTDRYHSHELRGSEIYPPFSAFNLNNQFVFYGRNQIRIIPCHPLFTSRPQERWWLLSGVIGYDS